MAEIEPPIPGIYFKLRGHTSQNVLFSRFHVQPQVWHHGEPSEFDDQFFTLIRGTGSQEGLYAFKGKVTGYVLFSRTIPDPLFGHSPFEEINDYNWFKLEAGTGTYAKMFRIVCPATETVIFSRTPMHPQVGVNPCTEVHPYQYFTFELEEMVVKSIDYDIVLEVGKMVKNETPRSLANQTLTNNSDHEQEMSFQFSESVTHSSTFEYTGGFAISAGMDFSAGIPVFDGVKITISASQSNNWKFGSQDTFSQTYAVHFPVKAGPHQTINGVSTVQEGTLVVPFTMHLVSKSAGIEVEPVKGLWRGVSTWNLHHNIKVV
ncbi:hypothetical protein EDD85DRAFT_916676 [Armillaria nabsnona]|nr:hypothetical protein EDD85DRAFT_916676 [Armillaria nabsnona]